MTVDLSASHVVLKDILAERHRQEEKWGVQNHTQMIWLAILAEEFGEAAKEINEWHFRPILDCQRERLRMELVQTAAVAVAMIESFDRNGR